MATNDGGFIGQDGLSAPDSPTGVSATAGDTEATISFTAPSDVGGSAITGYSVQSNNGDGTYLYSYNLENAAYASKSFSVSSQDTLPTGMAFNSDGTKLFVVGQAPVSPLTNASVLQYSLSTAYDISTATYDSVSFSVASQTTGPRDLCFKPDGTKMLIIEAVTDSIFQYSLSTGFDLTTASYDSVSLDISGKDTNPQAVQFNDDGTSLYFVGTQNDTVYQYDMSSAYDLSTASDASKSFSVTIQDGSPQGLFFKPDGTKFYIAGNTNDAVFQYSLSTAFDMSTASYDGISFSVASQATVPLAIIFNADGSSMYIVDNTTDSIYQYTTGLDTYPTASPVTVTGLTNGTSYTFNVWAINAFGWSSPSDASGSVSPFGARAIFGAYTNMRYVTISTLGNAANFGTFSASRNGRAGCSSSSRAVFGGGEFTSTPYTDIEFVEFATTGNATDFGDLTIARWEAAGASSSTRGLFATGSTASVTLDVIDYITIASAGNASDFGDASDNFGYTNRAGSGGLASSTRAVFGGGVTSGTTDIDRTYYVTIATTGNGAGFGGLTASRAYVAGASNSTRGLFAGGYDWAIGALNVIDYITIATTGDATDFGDLTASRHYVGGAASSTRALFASTSGSPTTIDYVTIASTGNAADFGDISISGNGVAGCSSAHGGLS